ncbi:MAG: hypothetical protein ACHQJ6_02065 [Candidatus Berkiellales bacterium]
MRTLASNECLSVSGAGKFIPYRGIKIGNEGISDPCFSLLEKEFLAAEKFDYKPSTALTVAFIKGCSEKEVKNFVDNYNKAAEAK